MKSFLKRLRSSSRESIQTDSDLKISENSCSTESIGYEIKEKNLSKLEKAIWNCDLRAVERHLIEKQMIPNESFW